MSMFGIFVQNCENKSIEANIFDLNNPINALFFHIPFIIIYNHKQYFINNIIIIYCLSQLCTNPVEDNQIFRKFIIQ